MSHFSKLTPQYKSRSAIVKALETMGFAPTVHQTAVQLEGYRGDLRIETAEIVVSRRNIGGASNDLGFAWVSETGTYQMIISEYDQRCGGCRPGQGLGPAFLQQFSKHYTVAEINASSEFRVAGEELLADGTYQLVVEKLQQVQVGINSSSVESWII